MGAVIDDDGDDPNVVQYEADQVAERCPPLQASGGGAKPPEPAVIIGQTTIKQRYHAMSSYNAMVPVHKHPE